MLYDGPEGGAEKVIETFDGERARWMPQLAEGRYAAVCVVVVTMHINSFFDSH